MKDFSQMTDEELDQAIIQKASAQPQEMDYSSLSDEEIDNLLIEKSISETPHDRSGEAFAQGFGNAATFGYLPQIQAATEPLVQGALDFFGGDNTDEKLKERGFQISEAPEESYVQRRDRFIRSGKQLADENPYSSAAGNISGALVSGIATGGGLNNLLKAGKVATWGQRAKNAAVTGGAIGAVRNPGDTEGEVNVIQAGDRIKNSAQDVALGLATQGGLEALRLGGQAVKNAGSNLKTWSQNKSLKASGAMLKDFRRAVGNKKAKELGQSVIDNKIMEVGDDVADIAKKAESAQKSSGARIGKIYDKADEISSLSNDDIRDLNNEFLEESSKRLQGTIDGEDVAVKLEKVLSVVRDNKNPTFGELRKLRASIDEQINYSRASNDLPKYQEELLHLRNKVQDLVKQKIGKVNPKLEKELIRENRNFSNIAEISKMAKDKMAREEANSAFGLRERISGGVGATIGAVVGGGVPGAIIGGTLGSISTKVARQYGTPFVAITANKVARALEKNQDALGKLSKPLIDAAGNPEKFVASINLMMKDPEFKKRLNDLDSGNIYRGPAKGPKR